MIYPYITFNDDTEITHTEMLSDGQVKVYIETPAGKRGFNSAVCWLPSYTWEDVVGYSQEDINFFTEFLTRNISGIMEAARGDDL